MRRVIDEPERAAAIGRAGREHMLAHFTLDGMVNAYQDLYLESARGKVAPSA